MDGRLNLVLQTSRKVKGICNTSQPSDGAENPFQVGRWVCRGSTLFKGIIDEVRISDVVRLNQEFRSVCKGI